MKNCPQEFYEGIDAIQRTLRDGGFKTLERELEKRCANGCGTTVCDKIKNVCWTEFEKEIESVLTEALAVDTLSAKAIYIEYDPKDEWQVDLFLCRDYAPEEEKNDDWACDWEDSFAGPTIPELPNLNLDMSLENEVSVASCLFVTIILTRLMSDVVKRLNPRIPVCLGFHCQCFLTRLNAV